MSVAKKKRISKKNKSAWRKTDIADVEEYLEEQRQEERIGSFADKKDEELFVVDATPTVVKPSVLTEKQKRKLNAKKPLRSLASLENTSKVQDPIVKRNHVKQKKSGRLIEEEVINPTKPRHFQATKDRLSYYEKVEKRKKEKNRPADEDIWEEKDFRDKIPNLKDEKGWISRDLSLHVVKNIGKPVVKVHDSIRHRTTKAKNFVPPHPGTSYNPSLEDHQALLNQVVDREEKIIKTEKHLKRVTTKMFSKVTPEEAEERRMKEMMAGLESEEEAEAENVKKEKKESKKGKAKAKAGDEAEEKQDSDDERPYKSVNAPVENKKKTRQDRNRELRHRELQRKAEEKRALKKQEAELNRLKSIKSEVLVEEEELNALKKHRKKVDLKKKFETKRLGRLKYEDPETDVNMAEDIRGNLREVKTESSLVVDRFKSFQKRNILPVSKMVTGIKKPKVKRFPRSSHKEAGVSYDMLRAKRKASKAEKGGGVGL